MEKVNHGNQQTLGSKTEYQSHICSSISECINWILKRKFENSVESGKLRQGEVLNYSEVCMNRDSKVEPGINGTCTPDTIVTNIVESGQRLNHSDDDVYIYANQASKDADRRYVEVLITRSLHLVGGALRVLWDRQR
ncbi:hypothetical protein DPMN_152433 [Dreissena polymorpha]|uniref:Uncharacterized protein n=1 Tax=Dreissena polymorpha TaxID=45954 RepID=A0A9D4J558_DREPO|nr:hypothetical protein DPMN_152433 [Dreissena polymorpha]